MNRARIGWSLWALAISLVAGAHLLGAADEPGASLYPYWLEATLITPTFATLGALIVSRRPGNTVGWLFLVSSVAAGMQLFSRQYATVALSEPSRLPAGAYAAWLSPLMQSSLVFGALVLLMLFPTGRLPSPRWRVLAWAVGLAIVISLTSLAFSPGQIQDFPSVRNPFGVDSAAAALVFLDRAGGWMGLFCVLAVVASLGLRFYRSRGDERLQIKWFAYTAALGVMLLLLGDSLVPAAFEGWFGSLIWTLVPLGLAISAGVAVLRYRLYDIDRLINRTLVYGTLTVSLAAVYLGGVALLQGLFRTLTGQEQQLQLVIVASTLAIAALFSPLRRVIQGFIDRRFYRHKYDVSRALEGFSAKLRDETDLQRLSGELVSVVRETVQPEHTALWLRGPEASGKPGADS